MTTTPHLGLVLLEQAQAQKEVTVNAALMRIDALLNAGAISKSVAIPPASPSEGDVYIVGEDAEAAWEGHDGQVAYFEQIWRYVVPRAGLTLWVQAEAKHFVFNGAAWGAMATGSGGGGGGSGGLTSAEVLDVVADALVDSGTIALQYNAVTEKVSAALKDSVVSTTKMGGDVTAAGKALLTAADAAAQRTLLGVSSGGGGGGGSSFAAGTEAAPSMTFTADTDTGLFNPAANALGVTCGGGETARFASGGVASFGARVGASGIAASGEGVEISTVVPGRIHSFVSGTASNTHISFHNNAAAAPRVVGAINSNGTTTSYVTTSDRRLKKDISPVANSGEVVDALRPVVHGWKEDDYRNHGFIAQEIYEVFPEAVFKGDDDMDLLPGAEGFVHWQMDASKLIPVLVAELQQLRARVAALEGNVAPQ